MLLPKTQAARNTQFSDTLIIQDEGQAAHYNMATEGLQCFGFFLAVTKKNKTPKKLHKKPKPTNKKPKPDFWMY